MERSEQAGIEVAEIVLRQLGDDREGLHAALTVMEVAYGRSAQLDEIAAYQKSQPDGRFVLEADGEIAATATVIRYGSFCWLGSVATHPKWRGQGFAGRLSSHLVGWAQERGCATVALDATDAARPIYERLGFRPIGSTVELVPPVCRSGLPVGREVVAAKTEDDVAAALALDAGAFGADRSLLLRHLVSSPFARLLVSYDSAGDPCGYAIVRHSSVGPGCAGSPELAAELACAAVTSDDVPPVTEDTRLIVPAGSVAAEAVQARGFGVRRMLTHMRFGDPMLPGRRSELFAQVSYAVG